MPLKPHPLVQFWRKAKVVPIKIYFFLVVIFTIIGWGFTIRDETKKEEAIIVTPSPFVFSRLGPELNEIITLTNTTDRTLYNVAVTVTLESPKKASVALKRIDETAVDLPEMLQKNLTDNFEAQLMLQTKSGVGIAQNVMKQIGPREILRFRISTENTPLGEGVDTYRGSVKVSHFDAPITGKANFVDVRESMHMWGSASMSMLCDAPIANSHISAMIVIGRTNAEERKIYTEVSKCVIANDFKGAREVYFRSPLLSTSADVRKSFAIFEQLQGNSREALDQVTEGLKLAPNNTELLSAAIEASFMLADPKVTDYYERLIAQPKPKDAISLCAYYEATLINYLVLLKTSPDQGASFLENLAKDDQWPPFRGMFYAARAAHQGRPEESRLHLLGSYYSIPNRAFSLTFADLVRAGIKIPSDPLWDGLKKKFETNLSMMDAPLFLQNPVVDKN